MMYRVALKGNSLPNKDVLKPDNENICINLRVLMKVLNILRVT